MIRGNSKLKWLLRRPLQTDFEGNGQVFSKLFSPGRGSHGKCSRAAYRKPKTSGLPGTHSMQMSVSIKRILHSSIHYTFKSDNKVRISLSVYLTFCFLATFLHTKIFGGSRINATVRVVSTFYLFALGRFAPDRFAIEVDRGRFAPLFFMPSEWNSGAFSFFFLSPEWNSGTSSFCPVCLSVYLSVCLWLSVMSLWQKKKLNLGHNFWTVRDRDFIFVIYTQLMKPFQMTPRSMTLWPSAWSWSMTYFSKKKKKKKKKKTLTFAITFELLEVELSYFTCSFLVMRPFWSWQ